MTLCFTLLLFVYPAGVLILLSGLSPPPPTQVQLRVLRTPRELDRDEVVDDRPDRDRDLGSRPVLDEVLRTTALRVVRGIVQEEVELKGEWSLIVLTFQ